jgi:hypothetical protein
MTNKIHSQRLISFLEIHKISKRQRAKMVNWIIEVLKIFEHSTETAFRAVLCLDMYLKYQKQTLQTKDLHLLGIVAIFIASKLSETQNISMLQLTRDIGKGQFTEEQIREKEKHFLMTLNFKISLPTIWSFGNYVLECLELPVYCKDIVSRYSELFQQMFLFSYDILNVYTFDQLAGFSIIIALKLFEFTHKGFSAQEFNYHVLEMSNIEKSNLLENLNFLRDYVSRFSESFPFNNIKKPN